MIFKQHHSSSQGNLYTVHAQDGRYLIIDPGVTMKQLWRALNYKISNAVGCLCGHEHSDHAKSAKKMAELSIPLWATKGTLKALKLSENRDVHICRSGISFEVGPFLVYPFTVEHDSVQPVGFVVRETQTGRLLFFAVDAYNIKPKFVWAFNIVAIGLNYDKPVLEANMKAGRVNEFLAKRLLKAHMSKDSCKRYLTKYMDLSKCEEIHLLHMSEGNIDKKATVKEFQDELFIKVVTI